MVHETSRYPPLLLLLGILGGELEAQRVRFTRVTDSPVATLRANTGGVSWVDFDGDGDQDLLVANGFDAGTDPPLADENWLFENQRGRLGGRYWRPG